MCCRNPLQFDYAFLFPLKLSCDQTMALSIICDILGRLTPNQISSLKANILSGALKFGELMMSKVLQRRNTLS